MAGFRWSASLSLFRCRRHCQTSYGPKVVGVVRSASGLAGSGRRTVHRGVSGMRRARERASEGRKNLPSELFLLGLFFVSVRGGRERKGDRGRWAAWQAHTGSVMSRLLAKAGAGGGRKEVRWWLEEGKRSSPTTSWWRRKAIGLTASRGGGTARGKRRDDWEF